MDVVSLLILQMIHFNAQRGELQKARVFFVLFHLNRTVEKGVICLCNYYEYLCMPFEGRAGVLESPFSVGENT
jgi:hypothetical protein